MKTIISLIYFFTIFLYKLNAQIKKEYTPLYIIDTLNIGTNKNHPHKYFLHSLVDINNNEFLKITDRKTKNLLLYDFKKKQFDTIFINKHWNYAERFESLDYVYIKNLDSIYISGVFNELTLINKEGEILNKWKYQKENKYGDIYFLRFYDKNLTFLNDSIFYITHSLFLDSDNLQNRKKIYLQNNILKAKLVNNKIQYIKDFGSFFVNARELYCPNLSFVPSFVYNKEDNLVALYFNKHDSIYIYRDEQYIKCADISSKYRTPYKKYNSENAKKDPLTLDKYIIEEPSVIDLQYDKFRKLYYVLYKHRQNYKNNNGTVNNTIDADISIIILDKNFNKKNEIVLKNNYIYDFTMLVLREGLAIGIDNEFQPHLKENKFKCIILDIDKYVN